VIVAHVASGKHPGQGIRATRILVVSAPTTARINSNSNINAHSSNNISRHMVNKINGNRTRTSMSIKESVRILTATRVPVMNKRIKTKGSTIARQPIRTPGAISTLSMTQVTFVTVHTKNTSEKVAREEREQKTRLKTSKQT